MPQTGALQPTRRLEVQAPHDARLHHVASLDASPDGLLVLQVDAAWFASTSAAAPLRQLALPRGDRALRYPTGVLVGSQAVVLVGDRFGTFTLTW